MADNSTLNQPTTSGDVYRSVQKGGGSGPKSQVVILDLGGSGTENLGSPAGTAGSPGSVVLTVQGIASGTAQPVSVASLPLPSDAATATLQTSGNAILTSIEANVAALATQIEAGQSDNIDNSKEAIRTTTFAYVFDGSTWDRLRGSSADGMLVNLGANNDVTIGAALPTGGNTIGDVTISGAALTSLQLLDDIIFVDDAAFIPASSKIAAIGYLFDDVATDTVDEGDIGIGRMSANRCQFMVIRDSAGNERGVNVDASNRMLVLASQSGTWDVTTVTTVTTLTGSGVAHDAVDSGNPHKIGGKAHTALSDNTLVADADRTDAAFDLDGALCTRNQPLGDLSRGLAAITDGSSTSVISAAGANISIYITDVVIANSSSSNVTVDLRDGTGGSVLATLPVPANGGVVHRFASPIKFSANTAVAADPSAAASTITVTLCGFKSKA